jgi:hypothetical protein
MYQKPMSLTIKTLFDPLAPNELVGSMEKVLSGASR